MLSYRAILIGQQSSLKGAQCDQAVSDYRHHDMPLHSLVAGGDQMVGEVLVGNQRFPASLVSVSPEIIQNQVTTRIRFSGGMPPGLRQNQRLTTRILMEEKNDVLTLQRGQFLDSGGSRIAYVLDEDSVAHRRSIEVGARSLAAVEIVNGLDEGEIVVISSIDQFRSADTVLVTN